ncbi:MAG: hypothetical protein B7Z34_04390 [Novosphingobium sp. 12-62-10]|nr:MAG: hypothetical protein B7Z34_04390 [Novosphingobium sp. 12-62-10]
MAQDSRTPSATAAPVTPNDDISADERAAIAQRLLTPTRRERCDESGADGAIVVCGSNEENARQRLPIPSTPDSSRSTGDGVPRAPNVSGLRDCSRGCIGFGSVPAPMYYFDITALPPPPEGSDADRIAKGEIRAP